MAIRTISDREFTREVLDADEPVLVAFRASWCMPSVDLDSILDSLAEENRGRVRVVAVDVDDGAEAICRRYKVTRLPVTMLIHQGVVRDMIGGMTSREAVTEMVERRLKPVLAVGELDFDREVLDSKLPVVVHFGAAWCSASQLLIPDVEELASTMAGRARVVRVEFGPQTARLCARFGVTRVPTTALFVDGQMVDQILGAMQGGTKVGDVRSSCVGLTTVENLTQMVERFAA